MGLDMYLTGKLYYFSTHPKRATTDGAPLKQESFDLGYWRKHADLHGYIVQTFAGGKDECQEIVLTEARIEKIIHAIKHKKLPHTEGFFFRYGDYDPYESAEADIKILNTALTWLKDNSQHPDAVATVHYEASW